MTQNTITELPDVTYRRNACAKYLRITVDRTLAVTVTIPRGATRAQAEQFVTSKIAWIKKQLAKTDHYVEPEDMADSSIDLDKMQDYLFERMNYFADKYGFDYGRVTFRCQKTKWGSCSSENNISLNINIRLLPKRLQDYLILHELTHTKIKNHSKSFWDQLDKYTDDLADKAKAKLGEDGVKLLKKVDTKGALDSLFGGKKDDD